MNERVETGVGAHSSSDKTCFAIVALVVVAQFLFMMKYFEPSTSGMDSHGYYGQAKLIATTGKTYKVPASEIEYVGYTWHEGRGGKYFTMWPPGFPVLVAVVYKLFGPVAGMYVNPVLAALTILGLFMLTRMWVGAAWGVFAAALLAVNPVANQLALLGYSHTASAFFLIWGAYFFAKWMEAHTWKWAMAAGLALGFLPSIRTPEIVITASVAAFALAHFRLKDDEDPNGLGAFIIAISTPVAILFLYDYLMFGSPLSNGYSLIGYSFANVFKVDVFVRNGAAFLKSMLSESVGFAFAPGVLGLVLLLINGKLRKYGVLLILIIVPINILYMAYGVAPDLFALRRFTLPTIPFIVISSVWFIKLVTEDKKAAAAALTVVMIAMTAAWGLSSSVKEMKAVQRRNAVLSKITRELVAKVEPGSVLIADEIVCQNLDYYDYWRLVDIASLSTQKAEVFGKKSGREFFSIFEKDLREFSSGRKVYWLTRKNQSNSYLRYSATRQDLKSVATIGIPRLSEYQSMEEERRGGGRRLQTGRKDGLTENRRMEIMLGNLANGKPLELYEWRLR